LGLGTSLHDCDLLNDCDSRKELGRIKLRLCSQIRSR
jgi:hypothetical protein